MISVLRSLRRREKWAMVWLPMYMVLVHMDNLFSPDLRLYLCFVALGECVLILYRRRRWLFRPSSPS